jgi:hypothetical protein
MGEALVPPHGWARLSFSMSHAVIRLVDGRSMISRPSFGVVNTLVSSLIPRHLANALLEGHVLSITQDRKDPCCLSSASSAARALTLVDKTI